MGAKSIGHGLAEGSLLVAGQTSGCYGIRGGTMDVEKLWDCFGWATAEPAFRSNAEIRERPLRQSHALQCAFKTVRLMDKAEIDFRPHALQL